MENPEEKASRGRPFGSYKGEQKRDRNIGIRVSESELATIKAKAEAEGKKLTQYIIDKIYRKEATETESNEVYAKNTRLATYDDLSKVATADLLVSKTHSELKTMRDNNKLIPGCYYRITDYVTTTIQGDTMSAGHAFDVIVRADSENALNENAFAIQHEGDTYFEESKLSAWKLEYCLDNDTNRFAWADATNGKGVIYDMIDEFNNHCGYDFKNIMFKRYKCTATTGTVTDLVGGYYGCKQVSTTPTSTGSLYPQDFTISQTDTIWAYTFNYRTGTESKDYSLNIYNGSKNARNKYCYENDFEPLRFDGYRYQYLNNVVFLNTSTSAKCADNKAKDRFHSNTFGASCYYNTFGNYCYSNTFGNSCYYNTFGASCYSNTFGASCSYNTFGNYCYYNTFGNSCNSNTFGNSCNSNTFGNYCYSNTFGNFCYSNTFGNFCYYNTFGNFCYYNTFGNFCYYNTFGNFCYYNTFGNSYRNISPILNFIVENLSEDDEDYNLYFINTGNSTITVTGTVGFGAYSDLEDGNLSYKTINKTLTPGEKWFVVNALNSDSYFNWSLKYTVFGKEITVNGDYD